MFCTLYMQLSLLSLYILSLSTVSAIANPNALGGRFAGQGLQNTNLSLPLNSNTSLSTDNDKRFTFDAGGGRTIVMTLAEGRERISKDDAVNLLIMGYTHLLENVSSYPLRSQEG